ncbi:hypothetical protein Trydic_g7772 [Trypoxylus dichotomus]
MYQLPWREVKEAIGSLLYLAIVSRPDLTFAISYFSQALEEPTIKHWNMVKRILRYPRRTTELGILYHSSSDGELEAFSDADYAGDVSTRHSTPEMIFKYFGGAIAWSNLKQRYVALSTTEAEFIAASEASKELIWLTRLYSELNNSQSVASGQSKRYD